MKVKELLEYFADQPLLDEVTFWHPERGDLVITDIDQTHVTLDDAGADEEQ